MKEKSTMKPILFSTPMKVQAILEGRKTQTRRVVKPQPIKKGHFWTLDGAGWSSSSVVPVYGHSLYTRMPYKPGDILWVRETWYLETHYGAHSYVYRASSPDYPVDVGVGQHGWRPSIFMPKAAARIFLQVADVRVERVQEITDDDALNEGIPDNGWFPMDKVYCPRCQGEGLIGALDPDSLGFMEIDCPDCIRPSQRFANLWNNLNAKRGYGWDKNPWVWVIEFERIEKPEVTE